MDRTMYGGQLLLRAAARPRLTYPAWARAACSCHCQSRARAARAAPLPMPLTCSQEGCPGTLSSASGEAGRRLLQVADRHLHTPVAHHRARWAERLLSSPVSSAVQSLPLSALGDTRLRCRATTQEAVGGCTCKWGSTWLGIGRWCAGGWRPWLRRPAHVLVPAGDARPAFSAGLALAAAPVVAPCRPAARSCQRQRA